MRAIYLDVSVPRILLVKALQKPWPGVRLSRLAPSRMAEIEPGPLPGDRWVRVENRQCGICATDISFLFAELHPQIALAALPSPGRIYLGHEVLGIVTEVGPAVTSLKLGDRVTIDTRYQGPTCASQELPTSCPQCASGNMTRCENSADAAGWKGVGGGWGDGFTAHETELYRIPNDLSDDYGMMIEPLSIGLRAVLQRTPEAGQHALVVGGGTVGLNTMQCLRTLSPDCHITAFVRYQHQAKLAKDLGADFVWRSRDEYQAVAKVTGGKVYTGIFGNKTIVGGFDVVYDCVGSDKTLEDSLRWSRAGGTVVMVGISWRPKRIDLTPIWHQEVDLIGVRAHGAENWRGEARRTYDIVVDHMRAGMLKVDHLITHRFSVSQWQRAIETANDKRSGSVKVVLDNRLAD